jgi:hypothetical protein
VLPHNRRNLGHAVFCENEYFRGRIFHVLVMFSGNELELAPHRFAIARRDRHGGDAR